MSMNEPCFCHFNGLAVKDATARKAIEAEAQARSQAIEAEARTRFMAINAEENARSQAINETNKRIDFAARNRKVLVIGDSYTEGSQLAEGEKTWAEWAAELMGLTINENFYIFGKGGAPFGAAIDSGYAFSTVLQTAANSIPDDVKPSITDIIVLGGANDWSKSKEEIKTGLETFRANAAEQFPNAKKWLFCAGWSFNTNIREGLKTAYHNYATLATRYGGFAVVHDAFKVLHNKNRMSDDEVHPNAIGQERIGTSVANYLNGGCIESETPVEHPVDLNGTVIGRAILNGWVVDVRLFCKTVELPESVAIGSSFVPVCSFEGDIILGSAETDAYGMFTANVIMNGATNYPQAAALTFKIVKTDTKKTTLYARSFVVENGSFVSFSKVTHLAFLDSDFTIPIWHA